jgi:hypothetical protein
VAVVGFEEGAMARASTLFLACLLLAGGAFAQEQPAFRQGENPYQEELELALGQPVKLYVEVAGTRFAELTITPQAAVEPGKSVKCQVLITGSRPAAGKVEVTPIFLLEDANGKNLERLTPPKFKVKGERPFEYKETVTASGDALAAAVKLWVFLEVAE